MLDPMTTQVIGRLVVSIAEEMGATLLKAAYSPNIKQRADRSNAIFDPAGQVIAEAQHSPIHLGSMLGTVEELMKRFPLSTLQPGDMFIANDPYNGGGHHLPDFNAVAPVFFRGELVAYVVSLGHHSDVGGMVPGSESGACKDIFQEGLRLPLVRLVQAGEVNQDILNIIMLNSRIPRDRLGDVRAQIAANKVGVRGMVEVCERYGPDLLAASMEELLNYGEKRMRSGIAGIPDGVYEATEYLDSDGFNERPIKIHLTLTVEGDRLKADFTDTDPQVPSSRNAPLAATKSIVYCVVRNIIDPGLPANSGYYRAIEVTAPPGCLLNPSPPGATSERSITCGVLGDVVAQALSRAVPARALAGSGPHQHINPSGLDPSTGAFFVDYETFAGGYGARPYKDGIDAVRIHGSGGMLLAVESVETNFPLLVERAELIQDSGGPGRYRGGLSMRRDYRILTEGARLAVCGERQRVAATGIQRGLPGRTARFVLNPGTPGEKILPSTAFDMPLNKGDLLRIETPGGGGCGDPLERDRNLVLRDLREERISLDAARTAYGVDVAGES